MLISKQKWKWSSQFWKNCAEPGIFLKILTSLAYKASHHSLLSCLLSRRHFASRENLWLLSKSRPSKAILFRFLSWYLYFTMSTGIPYIGTRISLISKSEIRYEGILYTIDTKESTVTLANGTLCVWKLVPAFEQAFFWIFWNLANYDMILFLFSVRSFGTEDRKESNKVPPRNEVYEYIVFRGLDIKDLHVCEPPPKQLPQDPAIVQVCQWDFFFSPHTTGNCQTENVKNILVRQLNLFLLFILIMLCQIVAGEEWNLKR